MPDVVKYNVWERFKMFICKLLSLKVAAAAVTTWMLIAGHLSKEGSWMWFIIIGFAIGLSQTGRINETIKTVKNK